eukprot:206179-Karenia_brevis.AAC.1
MVNLQIPGQLALLDLVLEQLPREEDAPASMLPRHVELPPACAVLLQSEELAPPPAPCTNTTYA